MGSKRKPQSTAGRYAYEGLDRVMHEKARLGVLTCLLTHAEGLAFNDLKELCALTDGNLSRHLKTLQEAGLVKISKSFNDGYPHTHCRITTAGRNRFVEYIRVLEDVLCDAAQAADPKKAPVSRPLPGWSAS